MTSTAGWHRDPYPPPPGRPARLRYWDGAAWTDHTAPMPGQVALSATTQDTTTPDGVPLASWGQRVAASLLDSVITLPITVVLGFPFYAKMWKTYSNYFTEFDVATQNGTPPPAPFQPFVDLIPTLMISMVVGLVFGLVWTFGWLRWKQATPGKLVLGLRIRLREADGVLPWRTIASRWLAQSGIGVLAAIPLVGSAVSAYFVMDVLWPLWDDKRQALHDKFAKTNVVLAR